jgi:hypothetical protein
MILQGVVTGLAWVSHGVRLDPEVSSGSRGRFLRVCACHLGGPRASHPLTSLRQRKLEPELHVIYECI